MVASDVSKVVVAARTLGDIPVRKQRWSHLSLCVLDAVFSIGARYTSTSRTVWAYATHRELPHVLQPAAAVAGGAYTASEEPITALRDHIAESGAQGFAERVHNRQRTSPRGGVLKAEAAHAYASVLATRGVLRLSDVPELLAAPDRAVAVEGGLGAIPGHGQDGIRVSYLWMLAGDDAHIKPDRMVLRWLHDVLGTPVTPREATTLLAQTAAELAVTPWQLDHAIWNHQRRLRSR